MKILNVIVLVCFVQLVFAQTDLQTLQSGLEKDYSLAEQVEMITLGRELPIQVYAEKSDSMAWHTARTQTAKVYVLWYEKMFDNGYKLNDKASILGDYSNPPKDSTGVYIVEAKDQKERRLFKLLETDNKKYAIATFLIAEQRLKMFMKNSYKSNKKKHFKEELLTIGLAHKETVAKIVDTMLTYHSYLTLYEVKAKKEMKQEMKQEEKTIMVKN